MTFISKTIWDAVPPSSKDPLLLYNLSYPSPDLKFYPAGYAQLVELLTSYDNETTSDLDEISIILLKCVAHEVVVPLARVFSFSLAQGIFPCRFKSARVVPIIKSGDRPSTDQ